MSDKKQKLNRRKWEIDPSTRVTPSSKIYKKKDRGYKWEEELEELELEELDEDEDGK